MVLNKDIFVLQGMTNVDLESMLKSAFSHHLGRGYFYNDCNFDDPSSYVIIYDKILSQFGSLRGVVEGKIFQQMSHEGVHRVMDQGCAHAVTLSRLLPRFSEQFPCGQFEGYGVSAHLKAMWLGRLKREYDFTDEEKSLFTENGIQPFWAYDNRYAQSNIHYFGIERDIHQVMKHFPFPLDLVISDNTYFHLVAPWMALKRTADCLAIGGVAIIRTLFIRKLRYMSGRKMSDSQYLHLLHKSNPDYEIIHSSLDDVHPVLAVIRHGNSAFRTHLHCGNVVHEGKYLCEVYSRNMQKDDLLSLDNY